MLLRFGFDLLFDIDTNVYLVISVISWNSTNFCRVSFKVVVTIEIVSIFDRLAIEI